MLSVWSAWPRLPLVWAAMAAGLGSAIDRWLAVPTGVWAAGAVALLASWFWVGRIGRHNLSAWVLLAALMASAGLWHDLRWSKVPGTDIGQRIGWQAEPVVCRGVVLGSARYVPAPPPDPNRTLPPTDRSRLWIDLTEVRVGQQWQPSWGRMLVVVEGEVTGLGAGDAVELAGTVLPSLPPRNLGSYDFETEGRSSGRRGTLWCDSPASLRLLRPGWPWTPWRLMDDLRRWCRQRLREYLPPAELPIATALLLGGYDGLTDSQRDVFLQTGSMHLLAISGLHVGIVAAAIFAGLATGILPRRTGLALAMIVVVAYCVLTEGRASVVRATVLVLMVCGTWWLWRRGSPWNSLAAAALVVWGLNPPDLFRLGPQLSFLAVGTLMAFRGWLQPTEIRDPLDRLLAETRPWYQRAARQGLAAVARLLLASLAVWFVTLPLVMQSFHLVSPGAIWLTPLLGIFVTLAMFSGILMLLTAGLAGPVAAAAGWACATSIQGLQAMIGWARELPATYFWVTGPNPWWIAGFYTLLIVGLVIRPLGLPVRWLATGVVVWMGLGSGLALWQESDAHDPNSDRPLVCTFLSVGHGAAIVVELPGGEVILYDCGRLGEPEDLIEIVSGYLWSRGISHLHGIVISHSDLDHFNGLPGLLERFSVGTIYLAPSFSSEEGRATELLLTAVAESGVPLTAIQEGDRLRAAAGVEIHVWHPPPDGVEGTDNANSLVLSLTYQGKRLLLTGDLEDAGLDRLLALQPQRCDVLQAPHHGGRRSNPPALAAWAQPQHVVVSCGDDRGLRSAGPYYAAGAKVWSTYQHGAIQVEISRAGVTVVPFDPRPVHY